MRPGRLKGAPRPLVSVVIPVEPEGRVGAVLKALGACGYPRQGLEVLVARGRNPSRQRNAAARRARGRYLLFLDSDSLAQEGLVDRLLECFSRGRVAVAGGPNLPPLDQAFFQKAASAVLGSWLGSMSARARYRPVGSLRESSEKELILCNLMADRRVFLEAGGFREDLYPNEENELLNRLKNLGWKALYQPLALVRRPRRKNLGAFARQAFGYGRGRMEQMLANFFPGDLVNLLPLGFLLYLAALPWLQAAWPWAWLGAGLYGLALLAAGLAACLESGPLVGLASLPLFPVRHLGYGLGLAAGLGSRFAGPRARDPGAPRVEKLALAPEGRRRGGRK